jgi:hypothetical protein
MKAMGAFVTCWTIAGELSAMVEPFLKALGAVEVSAFSVRPQVAEML